MDDAEDIDFVPQKNNIYNSLLPYADKIEAEADELLANIKQNLAKAVQLRDIKFGGGHWTGQLIRYIQLYGRRFSKEDHILLIRLMFELICISKLPYTLLQKFSGALVTLLKKKELLTRDELVLPWRPLYTIAQDVFYSPYKEHGMVSLPVNLEGTIKTLIRVCRTYFPAECTQEMLDEWRPLLCPFDITMTQAFDYFEMFLPTILYPHEHEKSILLWFEEFMGLWKTCQDGPKWEECIVKLMTRLAVESRGHIDWQPYIPEIFNRILRSLSLPVGSSRIQVMRNGKNYDMSLVVQWIASLLGNGTDAQDHLEKLIKTLESFYHPSNMGKWTLKLLKLLSGLPHAVINRIHWERKDVWMYPYTQESKLTDADITRFVTSMKPIVFLSMFGKVGGHESAAALSQLAVLRPELVIPELLEHSYPAMEALTEPHRTTACLVALIAVARAMIHNKKWYPEGALHVIPLLNLALPGMDPNDMRKSLITFQFISTLASLVPIADCSNAVHCRSDLTEEERELCSATAQFEDFVLQAMDRMFSLIENSAQSIGHVIGPALRLDKEEMVLEIGLLSTFNAIMQQSSLKIYEEALGRLHRFATTSIFEIKVAGRFTADLVRAAVKVNPEKGLKKFVPSVCDLLINRLTNEDHSKEEHLDNEILWNIKIISEVVRCDGTYLVQYKEQLKQVLKLTLHLKSKDGSELGGILLRHLLKSLTLIYALDYRSSNIDWDAPLDTILPIRYWGTSGDLNDLGMKWHIPSKDEKQFTEELIREFLLSELERLKQHRTGVSVLDREELKQSLEIIHHIVIGAGFVLPVWEGETIKLVNSLVELERYPVSCSIGDEMIDLDGQNVRELIAKELKPLLDHLLSTSEDDTKSLTNVIKVYTSLVFFFGTAKDEFEGRWKSLRMVKKSMQNKLLGKKKHIRALLVDRIQLQHETRVIYKYPKQLTPLHKDVFMDIFRLAVSRYTDVRKTAQAVLSEGMLRYGYSYRVLLDETLTKLIEDPKIEHHQFKGALYVVLGGKKRSLATKLSWDVLGKVWPALIRAQHSEKPSILKLFDEIMDKITKHFETFEIELNTTQSSIDAATDILTKGTKPKSSYSMATAADLAHGLEEETKRNTNNKQEYLQLISTLVDLVNGGTLMWKFSEMAVELLTLLIRHDIRAPANMVKILCVGMTHVTLTYRSICACGFSAILKQQKRPHKKIPLDPYAVSGTDRPAGDPLVIHPGDRPVNMWHHYQNVPKTEEEWKNTAFVDKTHWGYYVWPRDMKQNAPVEDQPKLGRSFDELSDEEKPVYECFNDPEFVSKLIEFMALEEEKGKDKFNVKIFILFKGLFRNFDNAFMPVLKPHIERLVADTRHDTHESSQRAASELIASLIRGAKHWDFNRQKEMWDWLVPVIRIALSNMTVESIGDWGTCFATSSESRDPRKLAPMLEVLMEDPIRGTGGSFGDSSRLYVLQGALAQQEWRVPELLHRLLKYLQQNVGHSYKSVRDRLASVLTNVFMCDVQLPGSTATTSPHRRDFIEWVLPQLDILKESADNGNGNGNGKSNNTPMEVDTPPKDEVAQIESMEISKDTNGNSTTNGESEERKTAVKVCKTVMKWLQCNFNRSLKCVPPEIFKFLPIICALESEKKDPELARESKVTLAYLAQSPLLPADVPHVLAILHEVSCMSSWNARAAILRYTQVMTFCNFFVLQGVRPEIQDIVVKALCDEQVEVREVAAVTLGGFLQCGYLEMKQTLIESFRKLSQTKIKKRRREDMSSTNPELLIKRHAGVLGLCACVQAFPYEVPQLIPQILMELSRHLDDPQPIQATVKKTLSEFKRTHHDNWHDHKQKFTDDQLVVLTDLLVSPNYYA